MDFDQVHVLVIDQQWTNNGQRNLSTTRFDTLLSGVLFRPPQPPIEVFSTQNPFISAGLWLARGHHRRPQWARLQPFLGLNPPFGPQFHVSLPTLC
jgi:hypothetical protein